MGKTTFSGPVNSKEGFEVDGVPFVAGAADWDAITNKPATFPATTPVATATALATGRTITVNFAASAAAPSFNGTANVTASIARAAAEADLAGGADLATTVTKVNAILAKLRTVGILAP